MFMKKLIIASVLAATASHAVVAPAAADAPDEFTVVSEFQQPDPCNPADVMTTTLTFDFTAHEHRNNAVSTAAITVSTDNGYSGSGRVRFVDVPGRHFSGVSTAIVTNADGDRFKVNQIVVSNPNGVSIEVDDIRCVRGD